MRHSTVSIRTIFLLLGFVMGGVLVLPVARANESAPEGETRELKPHEADAAEVDIKPGLAGSFLSSRFAKEHEDLNDAAKFLKEALARDPDNVRLKQETMRAALLAGDANFAISLAKQLKEDSKGDALVSALRMLDAVHQKKYGDARQIIEQAPNVGLFAIVRPAIAQWLSLAANEEPDAAEMQATIDKAGFFAPFLAYHVALMNDMKGHEQEALENYRKASDSAEATPYRVVEAFANFQARHGRWAEAQKLFDAYAKANPNSNLLPDKLTSQAEPVPPLVSNANEGLAEVFFTTASILFGEESSKDTFLYLRIALDLKPEFPAAQLMLANLYEQSGEYGQAIAIYDGMRKGNVFYRRAQVRKALNLEAMGKREEAIAYLDHLSAEYPADAMALITKGDMLRAQEKYADAAATYSEAVARSEPLKQSDWPLLYARGISYERAGQWPKAEEDFLQALKLEPNQPDVLNYLGYSWLLMNKNLKKASDYLEIAVSARPDDPHIIDSAGWARYMNGDYTGALAALEKAIDLTPDDATVNNHLGDVYWRLGRETEARFQWNRALTFKPEKDEAEEIQRKLISGLPIVSSAAPTAVEHAEKRVASEPLSTPPAAAPSVSVPAADDDFME